VTDQKRGRRFDLCANNPLVRTLNIRAGRRADTAVIPATVATFRWANRAVEVG
jgi:hypothetical protein